MPGKIKSGQGTLIGNAGEYYVVAELLKRGIVASLTPRNTPAFDVLATKGDKTVRIRVKTKSEEYDIWQWAVGKSGNIFRDISDFGDFTILVNLAQSNRDLAFYVVPTAKLDSWLQADFARWLATPGKRGQQRSSKNPKRTLSFKKAVLVQYRDNWDQLWD